MSESNSLSYNDAILQADAASRQSPPISRPVPNQPGKPATPDYYRLYAYLGRKSTKGIKLGKQPKRTPSTKIKARKYRGNGRVTTSLAQRNASRRNIVKAQLARKAYH